MAADLVSAVVDRMRAYSPLISAIGENVTTPHGTKIWVDFAEGRPSPPWITIVELGESITHDSPDQTGLAGSYATGDIQVSVFATGKKQSRSIGQMVILALVDAPLTLDDGYLIEIRDSSRNVQVEHAIAPGYPTIYHYFVVFTYQVGRRFVPSLF